MNKINTLLLLTVSIFLIASCNAPSASDQAETTPPEEEVKEEKKPEGFSLTRNGITLTPVEDSPAYPDASLGLKSPDVSNALAAGEHVFAFDVQNYELGVQTKDAADKMCANSGKGQHIHFILNNAPYTAHYEADVKKDLPEGHHVLLAFLSRSYHESLKTDNAFLLTEFTVGEGDFKDNFDETAPHMFYSRPKGTYVGKDNIERLLLDFFLVNADLSEDGYKVKATINGTEFLLTKWVPYLVEGLGEGTPSIILELIDKDDKQVSSPFNPVKREVTLAEEEPLPAK